MTPKKSETIRILVINNIEEAKKVFLEDWFIPGKWVNFQSLMEKGFAIKDRKGKGGEVQLMALLFLFLILGNKNARWS